MSDSILIPIYDTHGNVAEVRVATLAELRASNPTLARLLDLASAVDQLVLDALMGA